VSKENYYNGFRAASNLRALCERRGTSCRGWHLSELDTWHECPCNAWRGRPHPEYEEDDGSVYAVHCDRGDGVRVTTYVSEDLEVAKVAARTFRDGGYRDVKLSRRYGMDADDAREEAEAYHAQSNYEEDVFHTFMPNLRG